MATIIALLYFKSKKTNLTSKSTTASDNGSTTTNEVTAPKSSSVLPYPIASDNGSTATNEVTAPKSSSVLPNPIDVVPVKPIYIAPRTPIIDIETPAYVNPLSGGRGGDYVSGGSRGVDVTPIDSIGIDYGVRIGNGGGSSATNLGLGRLLL